MRGVQSGAREEETRGDVAGRPAISGREIRGSRGDLCQSGHSVPRRETESCAVGEGTRRATAMGRGERSPVPWGGAETPVHRGGQDTVASLSRKGVRELAGVARGLRR
eukprot:6604137-Pyramimonas_sp.AAC.1